MELQLYREAVMAEVEVKALTSFRRQLVHVIDPLSIASHLVENSSISKGLYDIIKTKMSVGTPRKEITNFLLNNLPFHTSLISLIRALESCGYTKLSSKLFLQLIKLELGFYTVKKTHVQERIQLDSFYKGLKSKIHDAHFKNPRDALDKLAKRFMDKFRTEVIPKEKQKYAEKCISILGAQIVAHAITYDDSLPRHEIFDEIKSLIPFTESTFVTDAVYYVGKAYANLMTLNLEDGENMLKAAMTRVYNTGPCLELINVLQIETYLHLWKFEQTPTRKLRDDILMWGRIGLESLEDEQSEIKMFWRRLFLLNMIYGLLGIGNRANIITDAHVDDECIKMAKTLLADFDQHFEGMEQRHEMFYQVAKARLNELVGKDDEALIHVSLAVSLAESGQFKEAYYIKQFKTELERTERSRAENESKQQCYSKCASDQKETNLGNSQDRDGEFLLILTGRTATCSPSNAIKKCEDFVKSQNIPIPVLSELGYDTTMTDENQRVIWASFSEQSITPLQEPRINEFHFALDKDGPCRQELITPAPFSSHFSQIIMEVEDTKTADEDETLLKQLVTE